MSDWEEWADGDKEVENNTANDKFANEALVDEGKEEREAKTRAEEQKRVKAEMDKNKMEKKKDEKDYEKIYNDRFSKAGAIKNLTREEIAKQNPDFSQEKISEMLSKQADEKIGDNLFEDDTVEESKKVGGLATKISELKGEKNYKAFGKEVAEYIISNGQSQNHIPKFFSELFHALSDKITVVKMRNIVTDFDARLKKRKDDEDRKVAEEKKLNTDPKKSKGKKKAKLGGVTKALDTNKMMMEDMFGDNNDDGEGEYDDYGDEGDGYVDYGRDDIDFI
jgi:hypothetical protein